MKKIVFFIDTEMPLSGDQLILLNSASSLANVHEYEVYYINNIHEDDLRTASPYLSILDINKCDYTRLSGAVFFVPINYLFHLLSRIYGQIKECKICLIAYDKTAVKRFFSQNLTNISINSFLALLKKTNSLSFNNRLSYYENSLSYGFFNQNYCPITLNSTQERKFSKKIISNVDINIAYISDKFTSLDQKAIYNLAEKLFLYSQDFKNIKIHIISDSNLIWGVDISKFSSKISLVILGSLSNRDLPNYLINNVDLCVTSHLSAIYCASLGLPTIINILDKNHCSDNKFVYFFDAKDYLYKWNREELLFIGNQTYPINSIISHIYKDGRKILLGNKCYKFFKENCSNDFSTKTIKECINRNKMTYKLCLSNAFIKMQLKVFQKEKEKNKDITFSNLIKKPQDLISKSNLSQRQTKFSIYEKLASFSNAHKFIKNYNSYSRKIKILRNKYANEGKIKIAFLVIFNSIFPTKPLFEAMLEDSTFDPYIIVIPNVSRSLKYQVDTFNEAFLSFSNQFPGRVLAGYDIINDIYLELFSNFNIVFFANPYKHLAHPFHHIEYFLEKPVLTIYANYGFAALKFWDEVIATDFYNYLWIACVETNSNYEYLKTKQKIKGRNALVTGYIKADDFETITPSLQRRKTILICPHHTVWGWNTLNISNFLKYSDFFIELPKIFPEIDFIFRPHPLLFDNLKAHNIWSQQEIASYIESLLSSSNITYDRSGDYFHQFLDSDAMIHDCGSFIGEYLYTKNPCCYMMKSKEDTYKGLVPLGQKCMDNHYHAFSESEIKDFISNVIINGIDPLKEERLKFVNETLLVNYPHSSKFLIDHIKRKILP